MKSAAHRAAELEAAHRAATVAATDCQAIVDELARDLVPGLVERGARPAPSTDLRAKRAELAALVDDREAFRQASRRAIAAAEHAVTAHAGSLLERLEHALVDLLARARPDAAALVGLDWHDVDAIHELDQAAARSFHALVPLAKTHDTIRQAAVVIYAATVTAARHDVTRRRDLAEISVDAFVGFGVVGPIRDLRGSPGYAADWSYKPGPEHPVERLVAAAVAGDVVDVAEAVAV